MYCNVLIVPIRALLGLLLFCFMANTTLGADDTSTKRDNQQSPIEATLQQAVKDLQNPDDELRADAAKLLGKYNVPQAKELLVQALDDPAAAVRRAACVSLLDGMRLDELKDYEKLLSKLGDPDVEVRRRIANTLPQLAGQLGSLHRQEERLRIAQQRRLKGSVARMSQTPYRLSPELRSIVRNAFSDIDPIVRLSVVKYYYALYFQIDSTLALTIFKDSDPQILLAMLPRIMSIRLDEALIEQLTHLASTQSENFQKQLAGNLLGNPNRELQVLFDTLLAKSNHPAIRLSALIYAEQNNKNISDERIQEISQLVLSLTENNKINSHILNRLYFLGSGATRIHLACTEHKLPALRRIAWHNLFSRPDNLKNVDWWLKGLADKEKVVRRSITLRLPAFRDELSDAQFRELSSSPYPDVRATAATLLRTQNPEHRADLTFDLLIDDAPEVRVATLKAVGQLRLPGWERILQRSLKDPNPAIQGQAADTLFNMGKPGQEILLNFAKQDNQLNIPKPMQDRLNLLNKGVRK